MKLMNIPASNTPEIIHIEETSYEYELRAELLHLNELDDENNPEVTIYTAYNRHTGSWDAIERSPDGKYHETCVGGWDDEKELAKAIYDSWQYWLTARFEESELFD